MNPESPANNKPPRSPSAANNSNMMQPTTAAENAAIDAAIDLIMGHQESDNDDDDDNDSTATTHSNSVVISSYNDHRSQRKHRTLKGRIKRTMAMNEEESSFLEATTTTASRSADIYSCTVPTTAMSTSNTTTNSGGSGGRREAESVLAAASTLASLGVTSPTSSTSSSTNRSNIFSDMDMQHQRVMSLGTSSYPHQTSCLLSAASSAPAPSSLPANTTRVAPSSILPTSTTIPGTTTTALSFSNVLSLIQPPPSLSTTVSTPAGVANDTTAETTSNNMVLAPAPSAANQNTNDMCVGLTAATTTAVASASNTVGVDAGRSGFDNRNNNIAAPQEEVSIGRPFASLLGSDIPLTFPQKVRAPCLVFTFILHII